MKRQNLKLTLLVVGALLVSGSAFAKGGGGGRGGHSSGSHYGGSHSSGGSHSVRGHFRKDGTYVEPHRATNRDSTTKNNWSHKGNVNPYTGKEGTKND